ncbi:hypothetical protein [Paenibacillus humicola]|uniref:hypothetical protein n=1 Tax=Paenibacillus humicola TaxID=3110540 RepID=UPI00237B54AE|nr:hypothetical protein [Paenibacillus humicola]
MSVLDSWQYIVLLGAVAAVGAMALPGGKARPFARSADRTVRNMETALEQFMENMEADNRELAELVARTHKEAGQAAERRDARIAALERRCAELERTIAGSPAERPAVPAGTETAAGGSEHPQNRVDNEQAACASAAGRLHAADAGPASGGSAVRLRTPADAAAAAVLSNKPLSTEAETSADSSVTIRERYAELFGLYDAGKSVEAVAKKLGMPKGEVHLIVQLSKREEETSC